MSPADFGTWNKLLHTGLLIKVLTKLFSALKAHITFKCFPLCNEHIQVYANQIFLYFAMFLFVYSRTRFISNVYQERLISERGASLSKQLASKHEYICEQTFDPHTRPISLSCLFLNLFKFTLSICGYKCSNIWRNVIVWRLVIKNTQTNKAN